MSDFLENLRITLENEYNKTERYDERIAKLFLATLNIKAEQYKKTAGQIDLRTLNQTLFNNFACEVFKPKRNINLNDLVSKKSAFEKADFFTAYMDLKQNYSTASVFALVFDKHGDALGDLVLHNSATYADEAEWCLRIRIQADIYHIQALKSFMSAFSRAHNV